jgi:Mg-chelatase subunit ChlD
VKNGDIVFVLDSSGSIGSGNNFELALDFLVNLVDQLPFYGQGSNTSIRIGMVQFTDSAYPEFPLNRYFDETQIKQAIMNVEHKNGETDIAIGMNYAVNNYFTEGGGDRKYAANVMLVLTDGKDHSDVVAAQKSAAKKAITTIAIGVSDYSYPELLEIVGGDPSKVFNISSFQGLASILGGVCTEISDGTTCSGNGHMTCTCDYGFTGKFCQSTIDWCGEQVCNFDADITLGDLCKPHGTCHSIASKGANCTCDPSSGYTGVICSEPIKGNVTESHRCYATCTCQQDDKDCLEVPPQYTCPDDQGCVPDDISCMIYDCKQPQLGWCLPNPFLDQLLEEMRFNQHPKLFLQELEEMSQESIECSLHGVSSCTCDYGWTGENCDTAIDWCDQPIGNWSDNTQENKNACAFGTCHSDQAIGAWCVCDPGWTGYFCDQPIPDQVHISDRCDLYNATNTLGCSDHSEVCFTDNLLCAFERCQDPVGWCVPKGNPDMTCIPQQA